MAQTAPASQDVQDIQFKLHDRFIIFPEQKDIKNLVSLLAVSSSKGLLFAANDGTRELKVFKLRDIVDAKTTGQDIKVRVIKLLGEPKVLACSCDGAMLAVNYILNDTGFLQIYQVESFLTPTLVSLYNLPIAPESKSFALQLLWNPVIPNNIALILIDGSVTMFTLSNGGQYDKVSLGKEHHIKSGCWSPKGKQIVFGFADGKLQQFKPNLQPARAILCPAGVHPGPFACIAVHWLSTFQFAVIFLQKGQDMCPSLFIVNAPKVGQPSYINYNDVCYSAPVPRLHQLSFNYIAQWNLLLVSSANGVEVGVLGTKETSETPTWVQYTLLDEARIEMPLTDSIDETYPLGFAIDTSSSHQLVIGEKKLPVMPMIHVLSTHGHLISYNFLNLSPKAVDICSPPPPLNDISGQFVSLSETLNRRSRNETETLNKPQAQDFNAGKFMSGSNIVTSTPAVKDKPVALFNSQQAIPNSTITGGLPTTGGPTAQIAAAAPNQPSTGFGFGASASPFSQHFGGMTTGATFGGFAGNTTEQINPTTLPQPSKESESINKNPETNKPLYTVPPTFTPPVATQQPVKTATKPIKPAVSSNKINLNAVEIDEVVKQMLRLQIEAFDTELRQMRQRSQQLMENIGSPDELKSYTKQLNDIEDIIAEANDHEFEQDVQSLRHSMNESYAMLAECRTKLDLYNNPSLTRLSSISTANPTNRRQMAKLQAYVSSNQNQLAQLNQLIDGQWSQYQDVVRRNSANQMHIPCLDGIYQRMSKLKDLLAIQRAKMNHIKIKLKQKGLNYKPASDLDVTATAIGTLTKNQSTIESLADAILSMSMSEVVSQTHAKLSEEKLAAIRNFTKRQQQIAIIKPKRPDRVGIKSEVILETKLQTERKQKEMAKKQQQNLQQQQKYQYLYQQNNQQQQQQFIAYKTAAHMQQQPQTTLNKTQQKQNYQTQMQQHVIKPQPTLSINQIQQQPILAKPTASKPSIVTSQPQSFITPTSSTAATLSFGGNSSFVKTAVSTPKSEDSGSATPYSGFGMNMGQSKPIINTTATGGNDKENKIMATPTPISFSAKVIGGNDVKPFANMSNKTITQPNTQGFGPPSSTGFSAFTTTKSMTQPTNQDKDIAKKPEEASKPFNFANTTATNAFTAFAPSSKSTSTAAPFSTNIFSSNTVSCTSTTTPFAALAASSSAFTFNATVTTSTSAANNSTKAVIPTAATVTAKQNEIKATPAATSTEAPASVTKTSAASNVSTTASRLQESKPETNMPTSPSASVPSAIPAAAPTTATVTSSSDDPTDSLFGSLNVCKPTAKLAGGDSNKAGNIFSGVSAATSTASPIGSFSFAGASASEAEGTKSFLSANTTTIASTTASTGFSFVSAATGNPPSKSMAATETATSISSTIATGATTATTTTTASSFSFAMTTPTAGPATPDSLFDSLSMSSSTAPSTATTTAPAANIFSGGSSMLAAAATVAPTTSLFGSGAAVTSTAPSLFASTAPAATTVSSPTSGSIFAATAAATAQSGGSLFGGIPKPEQSGFSVSNTTATQPAAPGIFAAAATNSKPAATTASSIFGGGSSTGFGGSAAGSIFGGGGSTATATSPFTSTAPPSTGGSIFNSPTQQPAASGGSLFGGSTFNAAAVQQQQQQQSQSPGSIFGGGGGGGGGGNAQSPTTGVFGGSGGSIFGGTAVTNASVSGGSLFSGSAATATSGFGTTTSSTGFGSFSQQSTGPAFGSPTAGSGFGAPASTTSFGSPQQQSAFAKPLFGGPPSFGSPQPAFGAQPTFGGAATFGGFGSFASTSPTGGTGFGAAVQGAEASKGNIFETLGSQDSGLSFGNLAHSTQAPQQPKPSFGGSSFMNYRS